MLSSFTSKAYGAKCVFLMPPKVSYHGFDSIEGIKKGKGKHKGDERMLFHNSNNVKELQRLYFGRYFFLKYLMVPFSTELPNDKSLFNFIFHSITPRSTDQGKTCPHRLLPRVRGL